MKMQDLCEHLDVVQKKIGYWFDNEDLLLQAFTRSSYSSQYGGENNEVLEFLGDRVLDFYVVKIIADRFGFVKSQSDYYDEENDLDEYCIVAHKNEAAFTELKKQIVSNETLAKTIDKLGLFKYMYLGDTDLENPKFKDNLIKVKADLFEAILGAVAIDSDWNQDELQNVVEYMLQIDDFLEDVDTEEPRPSKFQLENAVTTLKELSEKGRCSIPEYDQSEEQVLMNDGSLMWECTCYIRSWAMKHTAYATSKKEAKRYAAYLVLCDFYGLPDEFAEEDNE
ncbi:ribonuclease III domain-containing protein [Acholeplasma equifetale]|uniref:ribonuclease III domain-containing protein n=1 Tax=Acholeplasma equifetale TaxID=264634 RepID=UPI00047AF659|nr:ribonuclease III domain-containing protein [Acholeplasma equifetale]